MKQSLLLLSVSLLMLVSCTSRTASNDSARKTDTTENTDAISGEVSFETYIASLEQIPLPFSHNPLAPLPERSKNYNRKAFEKYKLSWTTAPIGILFNNKNVVTLVEYSIGDMGPAPFLITYDRRGNKIDSLGPYSKTGEDIGYKAIEYFTINKDQTIVVRDSVTTYSLRPDSLDIDETTRKVTTGLTIYAIEENGRFKKVNSQMRTSRPSDPG